MAQFVVEDPGADPVTPAGRLYVSPASPAPQATPNAGQPAGAGADPWAAFPDAQLSPQATAPSVPISGANGDPWASYPDADLTYKPPKNDYSGFTGGAKAAGRGLMHGITMGLEPAIEGASAAANPDIEAAAKKFGIDPATAESFLDHVFPMLKTAYGAGRTIYDKATAEGETPATKAYGEKRAEEAQANKEAAEQQPLPYYGGDFAGAAAVPLPGVGAVRVGANLGERVLRGVAGGMIGGGAFGTGNAIGEGKNARETVGDAANGVLVGGALGGTIGGIVGRRPPPTGATPAQRAAQTAEDLGAPLPRGVASDSPVIRATTAKVKEVPFVGERIGERVGRTQEAAAGRINEMAENLAGGAPTRTTAAPGASRSLQNVIEHNNTEIDRAYDALRNKINPDQHFPMPRLRNAIAQIELRRARAGWARPGEGLDQARNVANGVGHAGGFSGVHRLRRDLREAGNPQKANPGYDAGDFRALRRAADADMRAGIRHVAVDPNTAESLFNTAEMTARPLIQLNEQLERLARRPGENIVGALLNSAKEKSGNIQLLREMRQRMDPAAFNQLSGVLLHELGLAEGQVGEFSLARFVTNWNKVSDQAKALMFSPQHRQQIENIVGLGEHLKEAGRYTNNSHTGSVIVLLDIAKDVALLSRDLSLNGNMGLETLAGAGTTGAALTLTYWLGNPTTAASMSRWTTAYRALTLNQPSPARVAAFKVATRNLANNIHIPFDRIIDAVRDHTARLPVQAQAEPNKKQHPAVSAPRQ